MVGDIAKAAGAFRDQNQSVALLLIDRHLARMDDADRDAVLELLRARGEVSARALARFLSAHGFQTGESSVITWRQRNVVS